MKRRQFKIGTCSLCGDDVVAIEWKDPPTLMIPVGMDQIRRHRFEFNAPRCLGCGAFANPKVQMLERRDPR